LATRAGADPSPAQDHGFMFSRSVEDPDGNVWEIMWMDPAALAKSAQAPPRIRAYAKGPIPEGGTKRGRNPLKS
jgi:hypothetical protein